MRATVKEKKSSILSLYGLLISFLYQSVLEKEGRQRFLSCFDGCTERKKGILKRH